MFCILPCTFRIAAPFIFCTPIAKAKRRCRRNFDEVEIICMLKRDLSRGKRFRRLIIHWKMPPECDRYLVKDFAFDAGLDSFSMGCHGAFLTSLITQNVAPARPTLKTIGSP